MIKDKEFLRNLINSELSKVRARAYRELKEFVLQDKVDAYEIEFQGKTYDIEIQYFWDSQPAGNIRVIGSISDQSFFSTFKPLSDDFIMAPDGSFIGE